MTSSLPHNLNWENIFMIPTFKFDPSPEWVRYEFDMSDDSEPRVDTLAMLYTR